MIQISRPKPAYTYASLNRDMMAQLQKPGALYYVALLAVIAGVLWAGYALSVQINYGMGNDGITHPVMWGLFIVNFVFWVGIGHAGTLISSVLYVFRVPWRNPIYRTAEAMTVFAVMTAGLFPLIHLGRIWYFYWLFPYPNPRQIWVNFRSPLVWDVFAVSTYATVSMLFFYIGLVPDLAIARDNEKPGLRKTIYGILSLGWNNSWSQWRPFNNAYMFIASLAFPLVLSVHSVVSWDFAMSIMPGWHSTIFAPYFVAGAIFSGMSMVITILLPMRKIFKMEHIIEDYHMTSAAKMIAFTGLIVVYSYCTEFFIAWYGGVEAEQYMFLYRAFGEDYRFGFWVMFLCNAVSPLLLLFKRIRTNMIVLWIITIFVNIGMYFERFNIVVSSLSRDYDPAVWGTYTPSWIELSVTAGSFCWFFMWFLLYAKQGPLVATVEVKEITPPPLAKEAH